MSKENETIEELRRLYAELSKKLGEAEEALRFYANQRHWSVARSELTSKVFQDRLLADYSEADNTPNTKVAGYRARVYFETYGAR